MSSTLRRRAGFTLIELVVVIMLLLVLATLALMISPRAAEQQRIARGADQLSGWLLIAKQRSYRDQIPRGVRLIRNANNPNWVTELAYIERPVDIKGNTLQVPAVQGGSNYQVIIPGVDYVSGDTVLAGDFLQLNNYEFAPYNVHRIAAVTLVAPPTYLIAGTMLTLAAADNSFSPIAVNISGQTSTQGLYQIVRAPRVMVGEPALPLPRDVIIDLDPTSYGSSTWQNVGLPGFNSNPPPPVGNGDLYYDILFSERGQVVATNGLTGQGGKIILRVRNGDRPQNQALSTPGNIVYDWGDQFLVTIYTRTGLIATHPMNMDLSPPPDPFRFTRDGLTSGF
jgi:prepilin-type N-terminal cleavage/methylation domain-containing protein